MIQLTKVSKSFSHTQILTDISLTIGKGRSCILGKSGSGKSLLFKLILGLETPDEGSILLLGKEQDSFSREDWLSFRNKIGVVFQGSALFDSLTVFENVGIKLLEEKELPEAEILHQVIHCLQQVGLTKEILNTYPASLSGGMKKRVGIARAIIHKPDILFYDEPTSGLDPVSAAQIDELMLQLSQQSVPASIIITHDLTSVRKLATDIHMIADTRLVFSGTPDSFFQSESEEIQNFLKRE